MKYVVLKIFYGRKRKQKAALLLLQQLLLLMPMLPNQERRPEARHLVRPLAPFARVGQVELPPVRCL